MEQFKKEFVTKLVWYYEEPNPDIWVVHPERVISEWDGDRDWETIP